MLIGIDHLVIAVADPDAAAAAVTTRLGLAAGGGGRHDRLGTYNRLVWLGDTYLEFIGVFDPDLARLSWLGAPTLRALDGGGGLATWAIATDAIDADVERLRTLGSPLTDPRDGERTRPDGGVVRWRLATADHLAPDAPPFLIEHDVSAAEWTPSDRAARVAEPGRLLALEIAVDDPDRALGAFRGTLDLRFGMSASQGAASESAIGHQLVRLRRRERADDAPPTTVVLSIPDRDPGELDLLGCRWIITG